MEEAEKNNDEVMSLDELAPPSPDKQKYEPTRIMLSVSSEKASDTERADSSILSNVVDDFSLKAQGIGIRFRNNTQIKIYEQALGQLILEETVTADDSNGDEEEEHAPQQDVDDDGYNKEKKKSTLLVKQVYDNGYSFSFLRAAYSLMAIFVGGFLFILGFCILLFLFIDLATLLGVTDNGEVKALDFVAVLLSVPLWIYSLAMGMTLATRFVIDTFYGHPFFRSFGLGVATTDWIAFVFYLAIPVMTFIVTLFMKISNWWEISLLIWFASILIFWCLFSLCEVVLEVWSCLELMQEDEGTYLIDDDPFKARILYWIKKAWDASVETMRYRLCGTHIYYKQVDDKFAVSDAAVKFNKCCSKDLASEGLYSYFANKSWNPLFNQLSIPIRVYSLDEILGKQNYITRYSWSLQKLFCSGGGIESSIPITRGESSMTKQEITSSIVCHVLGNILIILLVVGILVLLELAPGALGIIICIVAICLACLGCSTYRMVELRQDVVSNKSASMYKYYEVYQHSRPKDSFTISIIVFEVVVLYLLPLIYLGVTNAPSAWLFAFLGIFSFIRHHLNPRILLLESEKRKDYFQKHVGIKDRKQWKKKSLLYHIVSIGGDKARSFWTWTYLLFVLFFCVIVISAANYSESDTDTDYTLDEDTKQYTALLPNYVYPPQPNLPYPTCRLKKGFGGDIELQDFAFLSQVAYVDDTKAQEYLDLWFGRGVALVDTETVAEFKESSAYIYDFGTAVSYKLITFPGSPQIEAALTIRGTQNIWDLCADAQLWLAAGLFQGLRFVLPFSELFTPILNEMVWIVSQLESENTARVSFYRETTGFVEWLRDVKGYQQIQVTGHSLGGGLAIITGAQTKTNSVAISGPNAMLSRNTFIPPLTVEELNTYTFNIVPAADPIPMFDDLARLYQNINCTAEKHDLFGCHHISRSICEIQYTCGSASRPVLCECVMDYGYPDPLLEQQSEQEEATGDQSETEPQSFVEACLDLCYTVGWDEEKCRQWNEVVAART